MPRETVKVLLIEDDDADALLFAEMLPGTADIRFELNRSDTVTQGIERQREDPSDIIVIDLHLPDGAGMEAFKRLHTRFADTPILILTGLEDEDFAIQAVQQGAQDYLVKGKVRASSIMRCILYSIERKKFERMKNEFVSIVSHELRTPLALTKEGISLVLDKVAGPVTGQQEQLLQSAKRNIDRVTRIINDLLDTASLESGKISLKITDVEMVGLIKKVAAAFEPKASYKGLKIKVTVPSGAVIIPGDPDKLEQVFTNLVGNAMKFTEKGEIELELKPNGVVVECAVVDTGPGIAPENIPRLFDKFQQFGRVAGSGEKGTGLGLAITKGLVELHNGKIRVESELEKGSRFVVSLPREP